MNRIPVCRGEKSQFSRAMDSLERKKKHPLFALLNTSVLAKQWCSFDTEVRCNNHSVTIFKSVFSVRVSNSLVFHLTLLWTCTLQQKENHCVLNNLISVKSLSDVFVLDVNCFLRV